MAKAKSAMWGAYRAPRHVAQMRALMAIRADVRTLGEEPGVRNIDDVVKEGARADLVRSHRNTNTNNDKKRARRAQARAFKAQARCAEFWNYDKL